MPRTTFAIMLFLLAGGLSAADWYVDTTGSDAAVGSVAAPFASIGRGAEVARAGDTVWIGAGTYQPADPIILTTSGSAGAPITFRNRDGGMVIVDGRGVIPVVDWSGIIYPSMCSWIVIDGLNVINSHWFGIYVYGGSDIIIRNCSTYMTAASGIAAWESSRIKVLGNRVQKACQYAEAPPHTKGSQECITMSSVNDFEIAYNTVFDRLVDVGGGGEGINSKGSSSNGLVHHNLVYDLVRVGIYTDAYGGNLNNVEIYANTVHHCYSGIVVANEVGSGYTRNVRVHDNLVYDCNAPGLRIAGYAGNGPVQDVQMVHNTVLRCGLAARDWESCGMLIEASNLASGGLVVRHNIFVDNFIQIRDFTQVRTDGLVFLTLDRNLIQGDTVSTGTNVIIADPRFADAAGNNVHLLAGSPAIDSALGPLLSTADGDGRVRPQDGDDDGVARADLGAFEYAFLPGDANRDGAVDAADLTLVKGQFGRRSSDPGWNSQTDLDHDNRVDAADLGIVTRALSP